LSSADLVIIILGCDCVRIRRDFTTNTLLNPQMSLGTFSILKEVRPYHVRGYAPSRRDALYAVNITRVKVRTANQNRGQAAAKHNDPSSSREAIGCHSKLGKQERQRHQKRGEWDDDKL